MTVSLTKEERFANAQKGGVARSASMTKEQRSEIASNAAKARWGDVVASAKGFPKTLYVEQKACSSLESSFAGYGDIAEIENGKVIAVYKLWRIAKIAAKTIKTLEPYSGEESNVE